MTEDQSNIRKTYEALSAAGVPVHPLQPQSGSAPKAPISPAWQTLRGAVDAPAGAFNVGLRVGAQMGITTSAAQFDRYTFAFDFEPPETITDKGRTNAELKTVYTHIKNLIGTDHIYEVTGGQHRGRHVIGISPLPFFYKKNIFELASVKDVTVDLYGLSQTGGYRNLCIAPSIGVKGHYNIINVTSTGAVATYAQGDVVSKWQSLQPITEDQWLSLMMSIQGWDVATRDKTIFIAMHLPLIESNDFNYQYFGSVISALAVRAQMPVETITTWISDLFKFLPAADADTVSKILKFVSTTYTCGKDALPGFPVLKDMLRKQIAIQRGYKHAQTSRRDGDATILEVTCEDLAQQGLLDRAVDWYAKTIELVLKVPAKTQVTLGSKVTKQPKLLYEFPHDITLCLRRADHSNTNNLVKEGEFLGSGDVTFLYGTEGSAKTWLALDMAAGITTGEEFWGGRYESNGAHKILYIYGDKASHVFVELYQKRYFRKPDLSKIDYMYIKDLPNVFRKENIELDFDIDIANYQTLSIINKLIKNTEAKLVIIDTLAGCSSTLEIKKDEAMKVFLRNMKDIAIENDCAVLIEHHSNKKNHREDKGTLISREDYQGAKVISALADNTITITASEKAYQGSVRIGKQGTLSEFTPFDYIIHNKLDDITHEKIVSLEFVAPQTELDELEKSRVDGELLIIAELSKHDWCNAHVLKKALYVGRGSILTPYKYKAIMKKMVTDGKVLARGHTNTQEYKIVNPIVTSAPTPVVEVVPVTPMTPVTEEKFAADKAIEDSIDLFADQVDPTLMRALE